MYRRIRDLREDKDLKQKDLAKHLGCSQTTYSDYETGKIHVPLETLIELSRFYQTSVDYLLDLTEPAHAGHFHPRILLSGRIPADWLDRRWKCGKNCEICGFCAEIQARATVSLNPEF